MLSQFQTNLNTFLDKTEAFRHRGKVENKWRCKMAYLCVYDFCEIHKDKMIEEGEAVACSKCGRKKPFHIDCFTKHNREMHNNKAESKHLPEIDFPV